MATLTKPAENRNYRLVGRTLLGRSSVCSLRLDAPDVSNEHAVISWGRQGWEIRDLGSRNATFVGAERLSPGVAVGLVAGAELRFGGEERWVVDNVDPPRATAQTIDSAEPLCVVGDQLLVVMDGEQLLGSISQDAEGRWILEAGDGIRHVQDGAQFELGGRRWSLATPDLARSTEGSDDSLSLVDARLRFVVGAGHAVTMHAHVRDQVIDFTPRGHQHLVYTLARRRVDDLAQGADEFDAGWIGHPELQELLERTRNFVNVNVHRARKQFEDAGFVDAACLIERRHGSGKLRLGVRHVEITGSQD